MRHVVVLVIVSAVIFSCKNEPYQDPTLKINRLTSRDSGSFTYTYRNNHIYNFVASGTSTAAMTFGYYGDEILFIVDSTSSTKKFTQFYGWGTSTITDSTIFFNSKNAASTLYAVRTVTYDDTGKPSKIYMKSFANGVVEGTAELTWQDENVVGLLTTNITAGTSRNLTIAYDENPSPYYHGTGYLYTLSLGKMFWLSKNNPILFSESGIPDKKYTFNYNKFGYPASFKTDRSTLFTLTYASVNDE